MERDGPVAILAGGGTLPGVLEECLKARGREVRILAFRSFAAGGAVSSVVAGPPRRLRTSLISRL